MPRRHHALQALLITDRSDTAVDPPPSRAGMSDQIVLPILTGPALYKAHNGDAVRPDWPPRFLRAHRRWVRRARTCFTRPPMKPLTRPSCARVVAWQNIVSLRHCKKHRTEGGPAWRLRASRCGQNHLRGSAL